MQKARRHLLSRACVFQAFRLACCETNGFINNNNPHETKQGLTVGVVPCLVSPHVLSSFPPV